VLVLTLREELARELLKDPLEEVYEGQTGQEDQGLLLAAAGESEVDLLAEVGEAVG